MKKTEVALKKLLQRKAQIDVQIQKRKALQKERERKDDARRKIILGGVCLKIMRENQKSKENMLERVKASIKPEEYQRLFSSLEKEESSQIKRSSPSQEATESSLCEE